MKTIKQPSSTIKERVISAASSSRLTFQKIMCGFEDRGILNSEMIAVCSYSIMLQVEVFIESGRWRGQSTEVLSTFFEGKPIHIESIEVFRDENALYVEEKMKERKNITLHYGDANRLVPRLVRKHSGKRIAILFDGPKGREALDIFRLALTLSNSIVVGFFHDMRKPTSVMPNNSRREMEISFPRSFFTDDADFVRKFGDLDSSCQVALWKPYRINGKKIGSYGPTLGIIPLSDEDFRSAHQQRFSFRFKVWKRYMFLLGVKTRHIIHRIFNR